ncbi:hypothetical protein, partial [Klebsiella michiganensis]|uniref:hypothetical protein n=1 Tax=Klebsiella michiganensis TaxID=1134687 RepID=UPI0035C8566A
RLRFSGPKTSIICSPMTSLKTSIKNITYLSDIGCLEIQGASLPTLKLAIVKTPAANDLRKKLIIPVPYSVLISGC